MIPDGFCSCGYKFIEVNDDILCPNCDKDQVEECWENRSKDDFDLKLLELHNALQDAVRPYAGLPIDDHTISEMQFETNTRLAHLLPLTVRLHDGIWTFTGIQFVKNQENNTFMAVPIKHRLM